MTRLIITISALALNLVALFFLFVAHDLQMSYGALAASTVVYSFGRTRDSREIVRLKQKIVDLEYAKGSVAVSLESWKSYALYLEKRLDGKSYIPKEG